MSVLEEMKAEEKLTEDTKEYKAKVAKYRKEGFATLHFWIGQLGWRRKFWGRKWRWPLYFQFGHVSLTLTNGTHISFWSMGKDGKSYHQTIDKDILGESRLPDHHTKIPTRALVEKLQQDYTNPDDIPTCALDENKVKVWWDKYKDNTAYESFTNNCAQTVSRALMNGGFAEDEMLQLLKEMRKQQYEAFSKLQGLNPLAANLSLGTYQFMFKNVLDAMFPAIDEIINIVLDAFLNQSVEDLLNLVERSLPENLDGLPESDPARIFFNVFRDPGYWSMVQQILQVIRALPPEDKKALLESIKESLREMFPQGESCDCSLTPAGIYNAVQEKLGLEKIKKVLIFF